jgi:hypothetical protein
VSRKNCLKVKNFRNNFFWKKPSIKENNVSPLNFIEDNHATSF